MSKRSCARQGWVLENLVKTTIILADRKYGPEHRNVRKAVLGTVTPPASTVIIAGLYDSAWMIEIEGVAVA